MSSWYHSDPSAPDYFSAMRKVMSTQPEVSALAGRIFGDEVLKKAEQAGIDKSLVLSNLALDKQKVDLAKEKVVANKEIGSGYNALLRESAGLRNWKDREKLNLVERQQNTSDILGAVGLGVSAYSGYQKMKVADKLSKDERIKYLLGR
jgi:hypothetical protein